MLIKHSKTGNGLLVQIDGKRFRLGFPGDIWKKCPEDMKDIVADNSVFLSTMHLPLMLGLKEIKYDFAEPVFKSYFFEAMLNNIPFTSDADGKDTAGSIRDFLNARYLFSSHEIKFPSGNSFESRKYSDNKAVINFTFGKDSLLSYAVAQELGMECFLTYVAEGDTGLENKYKDKQAEKFRKEFGVPVNKTINEAGWVNNYRYWKIPRTEWGYGHLLTDYTLKILPYNHYYGAKYIIFGNEKSCNASYMNKDGYLSYPVYDQTALWMKKMDSIAKAMSNGQLNVVSLIEPLHDMSVMKILHSRYPKIGKYQMSCFPDESKLGKENFWCHDCSKCARVFVYAKAIGLDPKKIGFRKNLFDKGYENLYSCFGRKEKMVGWDKAGTGVEEQLFAFYLAYKRGETGYLIDKFKENFLAEVKPKEDKLYKEFFSVGDSITMNDALKKKAAKLYKEELSKD